MKKCGYFQRFLKRSKFWLRYKRRRIVILTCVLFLILILLLHFLLLPTVTGAYNDDCYLSEGKLNELRHLILVSARLMAKYNMTYWLDFGTLLGAAKFGDVIPWDGDADISSIYNTQFDPSKMNLEFADYSIHRNGLIARVNNSQLDYYRWTIENGTFNGVEEKILKKYYPKWVLDNENIFLKLEHNRESLPLAWVVPTKTIDFLGIPVAVPGEYEKVLEARYPLTYQYNIFTPYKWKCWLPCWLTADATCKKYFVKRKQSL